MLIGGCISEAALRTIRQLIFLSSKDGWELGDQSNHSWTERCLKEDETPSIFAEVPLANMIAKVSKSAVAWVNIFHEGEWIAAHKDSAGDLQMILGIDIPVEHDGGQFWIQSEDFIIPLQTGDILVLDATQHIHGTTPVGSSASSRMTVNIRFWL